MTLSDYRFSYREKDGKIQLILSYKIGTKWRQKAKQGFKTKKDAAAFKDRLLRAARDECKTAPEARSMTVDYFVRSILLPDKKGTLAETSARVYGNALKCFPELARMPLAKVKYSDITAAISKAYETGLKTTTLNSYIAVLRHAFGQAVKPYGLISASPAADIKRLKTPRAKIKALTAEQAERFMGSIDNTETFTACAIALYNGLRFGEVAALTWGDVDFTEGTLSISKQINVMGKITRPKSENGVRVVPMAPKTRAALLMWREVANPETNAERVFTRSREAVHYKCNAAIHALYPEFHFHSLRHTFATLLLKNGADIQTLAALLGDTPATVMKNYIHYTDDLRAKAKTLLSSDFY